MTTQVDEKVEAAARKLQNFVEQSRRAGGLRAKVGDAFAGDPAFLRKLKPSLIAARAKGRTPAVPRGAGTPPSAPVTPVPESGHGSRARGGPSPWLVLGAALAIGVLAAKTIDWRADAHPRG